jgi:hypothetical protein
LIIDPSLHRTSEAERDRLDSRLGDAFTVYLERGYRPSPTWLGVEGAAILLALVTALTAAGPRSPDPGLAPGPSRTGDIRRPSPRRDSAVRAALCATIGALLGVAAGYVTGAHLRWPMTVSDDWEPIARVPFSIPWWFIIALLLGIPVLTAALAALLTRGRPALAPSSAD